VALAALLRAGAASACPVCGLAANDASQGAYINMSIVISLLPLAAIGSIVAWVALRIRAAGRAESRAVEGRLTRYPPAP
jgi:hypothetical protein